MGANGSQWMLMVAVRANGDIGCLENPQNTGCITDYILASLQGCIFVAPGCPPVSLQGITPVYPYPYGSIAQGRVQLDPSMFEYHSRAIRRKLTLPHPTPLYLMGPHDCTPPP